MKKSFGIHLSALFLLFFSFASHGQNYSGGAGTASDPFLIANKTDLHFLSEYENHWDKYFRQTADIYFVSSDFQSGGDFYNNGEGFKTLGNDFSTFLGTYDGNGHIIDSLYINRPTEDYQGFFGKKTWGSIRGLGLTHAFVKGQSYNGVLAGYFDDGDVADCYTTGNVYGSIIFTGSNLNFSGGLIGYHSNGIITRSYSDVAVNGNLVGGLAGFVFDSAIIDCYATGNVDGNNSSYVGGLIGMMSLTSSLPNSVVHCYATGNVSGNFAVGGLIGHSSGIISNCFASGAVNGNYDAGGLIGYNASNNTIINCYATGTVNGLEFLGGLIGYNFGLIRNSHSVGNVICNTVNDSIGGLAGGNQGSILHCFWDMQTSGITTSFGGIGLTTSAMKNIQTFIASGWDFEIETSNGTDDIWKISDCSFDYPVFSWQTTPPHPTSFLYQSTCRSFTWPINGQTYISTGVYLEMVENSSGCDSLYILNLQINLLPSDFVFDNGDGTLVASIGDSYQWINCATNTLIPGATDQIFTPSANGFYSVTVSYNTGCSVTSDCIAMENLGLFDWSSDSLSVFPNPTQGSVTISLPIDHATITITDVQSKTHFVGTINNNQQINLTSYKAGVYFLSVETKSGIVLKRIVKQ